MHKQNWISFTRFLSILLIITLLISSACNSLASFGSTLLALPTHDPQSTLSLNSKSTPTSTSALSKITTAAPSARVTPTLTVIPGLVQYGPGEVTIPVLLYHHILVDTTTKDRYAVSLDNFIIQMNYLRDHGYHTVNVTDMVEAVTNGRLLPSNPIVITFDDGNRDIYELAFPILKSMNYVATMYLIGIAIGADTSLTTEMINELAFSGWEIGSHSMTHADLMKSDNPVYEICTSKKSIEAKTGLNVRSFAYPNGIANKFIKQMAQDCGYTSGAGLDIWITHSPKSLFYFSRREVQGDFYLDNFIGLLSDPK